MPEECRSSKRILIAYKPTGSTFRMDTCRLPATTCGHTAANLTCTTYIVAVPLDQVAVRPNTKIIWWHQLPIAWKGSYDSACSCKRFIRSDGVDLLFTQTRQTAYHCSACRLATAVGGSALYSEKFCRVSKYAPVCKADLQLLQVSTTRYEMPGETALDRARGSSCEPHTCLARCSMISLAAISVAMLQAEVEQSPLPKLINSPVTPKSIV